MLIAVREAMATQESDLRGEIIVVNDGSSDGSERVLKQLTET